MLIDFSPVRDKQMKIGEFAEQFTLAELRRASSAYIDEILAIIDEADDADFTFIPHDPDANDPFAAIEAEKHVGWSLGHLIAHVTASSEEAAAFSSLLARGVELIDENIRLRFETPWEQINSKAKAIQRLEESRRIRLAYLDTWPEAPNLQTIRPMKRKYMRYFGPMNATAAFLFGLAHEDEHLQQMRATLRQAKSAAII